MQRALDRHRIEQAGAVTQQVAVEIGIGMHIGVAGIEALDERFRDI